MLQSTFPTIFYCVFLFFLSPSLNAQVHRIEGWEHIQNEDFVAARASFLSTLKQKPKDVDALCGLIFIDETRADYAEYKKHIRQLIDAKADLPHYFGLFNQLYEEEDPTAILAMDIPEELKLGARSDWADSLFFDRKFKESILAMRDIQGDFDWSVIGPFNNVSGSGYVEEWPIEREAFSLDSTYQTDDFELKWNQRILRSPWGDVVFKDALPAKNEGTYYANTFLTIPEDRKVQLRIARTAPMKIWMDDDLIFQQNKNISFGSDFERVEITLSKGTHRLLVKLAPLPEEGSNSKLDLSFHEQQDIGISSRYRFSNYEYNRNPSFSIRITDLKGVAFKDILSSFEGQYLRQNFAAITSRTPLISYFKHKIEAQPEDLKNYYLLAKAFLKYGLKTEGEEVFASFAEAQPSFFLHYLLAKFYVVNNKGEKAEVLISGVDEKKLPIFAVMQAKLMEIDKEKKEEEYLEALDKLLAVSPTHWKTIFAKLDYFAEKGKTKEKRFFIKQYLKEHPNKKYKKRLKPYLEDDSYKPSSYTPRTDKEKDKEAKEAMKRMRKKFIVDDYAAVIDYYKNKEKTDKVIKLYDQIISIYPYTTYRRKEKAKYLFEKNREEEAIIVLNEVLSINPYDADALERMGDIYFEKEEKEKALVFYRKAVKLNVRSYRSKPILDKIEKIKNKKSAKKYFQPLTFDEVLADSVRWNNLYPNEESVILLYTEEGLLDKENEMDFNQKLMIKIQNEAGAKYWTEANFGFLGSISFVKVIKPDGRTNSPSRSYGRMVFKNLQAGDIIQIEGNSKMDVTKEIPNEMYHIVGASFEVPLYSSRIEYIIPKEKKLAVQCNRFDCTYKQKSFGENHSYLWDFKEVKKMDREDAVKDYLDSYTWIMSSTMTDWSKVVDWYQHKTYARLEPNYEVLNTIEMVIEKGMTDEEKVLALYNYLTKEITYSFVSFLNSSYTPKRPGATLSGKIGDCKDVATLMISMLREVGIPAWYVLVRSGSFTEKTPLPTISAFNHVIVGYQLAEGKMQYLDLTTDYFPHYVLPESDASAWALLIKDGEKDVFRLPDQTISEEKSRFNIKIKAKLLVDRSLELDVQYTGFGVLGGMLRESLNRVSTLEDRKKFLTTYFAEGVFDHLILKGFGFENLKNITAPLLGKMQMKAYNHAEKVSDFFIVQIPMLKGVTTRPALFSQKRYNNLDLSQLFELTPTYQHIELQLLKRWKLMSLPKNILIDNEFGHYELSFERMSDGVLIQRALKFKNRLVKHEDYDAFKAFYLEILDADRIKLGLRTAL